MRRQGWLGLMVTGWLVGCGAAPEPVERQVGPEAMEVEALACGPGQVQEVKQGLPSRPSEFLEVAGALFFFTKEEDGDSLWKSDGTSAGTLKVKTLPRTGEQFISNPYAASDLLFFTVHEAGTGTSLWVSDGTSEGTRRVKTLPGCGDFAGLYGHQWINGVLTFFHQPCGIRDLDLWRSDGTEAGTFRIHDLASASSPPANTPPAPSHIFITGEADGTFKLWRSDGTAAGTYTLPIPGDQHLYERVAELDGTTLFVIKGQATGTELWRTDGTASGTWKLKRLDASTSGVLGTTVKHVVDGKVVFSFIDVDDGSQTEIWQSDGTEAGTVRVDTFGRPADFLGVAGSSAVVATFTADHRHMELRRLSLTGGGKALVATLENPRADQGYVADILDVVRTEGRIFITQLEFPWDGLGETYLSRWVTDGTAAGTRRLATRVATQDAYRTPFFVTGTGTVMFAHASEAGNLEPWVTDGTLAGTRPIADLWPGSAGSDPAGFRRLGDRVYFTALKADADPSLWSVPADLTCH